MAESQQSQKRLEGKSMINAKALSKAELARPNLSTKSALISFRLSEYTLEQIDRYCDVLNMNRNNVIEVMLHVFLRYSALTKQERRSKS
jgi:hypothetical protein